MSGSEVVALVALAGLLAVFMGAVGLIVAGEVGGLVGAVCGIVIVIACVATSRSQGAENRRLFLASEIGSQDYQILAGWKGTDCALDRMIAKAMSDGKVTEAEAKPMWARTREIYKGESRALLGGMDPSATCRTGAVKA